MKLILASLLFIFCWPAVPVAFAQYGSIEVVPPTPHRIEKLHYSNSVGEISFTVFEYDEKGLLKNSSWRLEDGSRSSKNVYIRDEDGRIFKKYREFSDGLTSTQIYNYDEKGNLRSVSFERSDQVSGITHFHHDEKGAVREADCKGLNGWFHGTLKFNHDDRGRLTGGEIFQKGKKIGTIRYAYDATGAMVREHWNFTGKWNQTCLYEYSEDQSEKHVAYSSSNVFITQTDRFKLVRETYDFNGEDGGPSTFFYNVNNRLEKKDYENNSVKTTTTYEYDDQGLLTRSLRQYSSGLEGVFTYEFNEDRQLVRRLFKRSDGAEGKEKYEYDEKGRLVRGVYEKFDSWISGVITFEHDENGRLEKGKFKGKDGFDAELVFTHDKHGNVTRIVWHFSFGKTQTYRFEYEAI